MICFPEDFVSPIELDFGTNVEYLEIRISDEQIIGNSLLQNQNKMKISPFLLKANEEVEITGFVSSENPINLGGPLVRIKSFKIVKEENGADKPFTPYLNLFFGFVLIVFSTIISILDAGTSEFSRTLFYMSFVFIVPYLFYIFINKHRKGKK